MMRDSSGISFAFGRPIARAVELVVVREDDGNDAAKRSPNRFQDRDATADVRPDLRGLDLPSIEAALCSTSRLTSSFPMS